VSQTTTQLSTKFGADARLSWASSAPRSRRSRSRAGMLRSASPLRAPESRTGRLTRSEASSGVRCPARYGWGPREGRALILNHSVVLALDGFDEVTDEHRAACVRAINRF
jgi:hypothetical protein